MADRREVWINRPDAKAHDIPYTPPPVPANPVIRGLVLYYLAKVVVASGFVQSALWSNAGFNKLRNRPELKGIEPRYDPTVIKTGPGGSGDVSALAAEDWSAHRPAKLIYRSILDYHEAYKAGTLTPIAVAEALLPLIRRDVADRTKHSTAFLDSKVELIRRAAEASTQRYKDGKPLGLLDGVPVAVKDEADVTGYRKCYGSKLDFTAKGDITSYSVQQWLDAGAVLVGKTTMHELGMDTTNNNPNYGTPLNPYNDRYYCGGSSGGSSYAVSAGLVPVAMGNDGGGSVRIPSAYCGLYGLKPSHSRVSLRPSRNLAKSTCVSGPLAANMVDLEISYRIMAAPDSLDADAKFFVAPGNAKSLSGRKKVLGVFKEWFDRADETVKHHCQRTIDYLTSQQGYEIVSVSLPLTPDGQIAHAMTILNEIGSVVESAADLTPANQILVSAGNKTPGVDLLQAQKLRHLLMQHVAHLYEQYPGMILVTPTTPNAGWCFNPNDLRYGCSDANTQVRNMEYVFLANFTGCPAITAPVGYVDPVAGEGQVPVALMGMGEWCSEDALIAFGYDCEKFLAHAYEGGRLKPANFVDVVEAASGH